MTRCTHCKRLHPDASYRETLSTTPPETLTYLLCSDCRQQCDRRSQQTDHAATIRRQAATLGLL